MFALHDPLHARTPSTKHLLKDEPLIGHHHHQIHPISVRNWMHQSSIAAEQPAKSVSVLCTITCMVTYDMTSMQ